MWSARLREYGDAGERRGTVDARVGLVALIVGVAIVTATALLTAARYGDLPDSVPIHFGLDGRANSYGPRSMLWLPVGIQLMLALFEGLIWSAAHPPGVLIMVNGVLAVMLVVQVQILGAATSRTNRISMGGFWIVFALLLAAGTAAFRLG